MTFYSVKYYNKNFVTEKEAKQFCLDKLERRRQFNQTIGYTTTDIHCKKKNNTTTFFFKYNAQNDSGSHQVSYTKIEI